METKKEMTASEMGKKARAMQTKEERTAQARMAALARWSKRKPLSTSRQSRKV